MEVKLLLTASGKFFERRPSVPNGTDTMVGSVTTSIGVYDANRSFDENKDVSVQKVLWQYERDERYTCFYIFVDKTSKKATGSEQRDKKAPLECLQYVRYTIIGVQVFGKI